MAVNLTKLQREIYQNKVRKGFNVTDIKLEVLLILEELAELSEGIRKEKKNIGEEVADIMIYCLGLCEILGINAEKEILRKVAIIKKRRYQCKTSSYHRRIK